MALFPTVTYCGEYSSPHLRFFSIFRFLTKDDIGLHDDSLFEKTADLLMWPSTYLSGKIKELCNSVRIVMIAISALAPFVYAYNLTQIGTTDKWGMATLKTRVCENMWVIGTYFIGALATRAFARFMNKPLMEDFYETASLEALYQVSDCVVINED